jgi:hypothetical protein
MLADMADPYAQAYIVRDVASAPDRWRWTGAAPELRFWLTRTAGLNFVLDFYLAGRTFKETGPVTVACYIEGKLLGSVRADGPREFTFEKAVPAGWLTTERPVNVMLRPDKVWVAPDDGARLGILLVKAGFVAE